LTELARTEFLRAHPEFFKLWSGQAVSTVGSRITTVAMPLAAVVMLHASPLQMGVLSALAVLPHLLFGLMVGVWVDRLRHRTILIVADLGRALVLGSVPILGFLQLLRMEHLYAVAFLTGLMSLLFATAATSLVPALVGRANLLRANSALVLNDTVARTAVPTLAGWVVQALSAPAAIAFDALSFVVSAGCSRLIRVEPAPGSTGRGRMRLWSEMLEGLRVLFGNAILSPITISATVGAFAGAMQGALVVLYFVQDLSLTPTFVGLALAVSGLASVVGALLAGSVSQRLGLGPAYLTGGLLSALAGLFLAAAAGPSASVALFLVLGQLLAGLGQPLFSVPQTTLRQSLVADHVLGRVNASWRFLVFGAQPLGALLGGALGATLGLRATLVVSSFGMLAGCLWAFRSPVRSLRQIPAPAE
jgi:MFS family permease